MKPRIVSLAILHGSLLLTPLPGLAADPLPAPELDSVFIAQSAPRPCKDDREDSQRDCPPGPDQLKNITDHTLRESTTPDPNPAAPQLPSPQLPPEPDVTPQQLQLIEDFTHRPWGR